MDPVALIVLDGFGLAEPGEGNAVHLAETPVFDELWTRYPHTELAASGEAVGLPEGQIGNSEVGHLNLGAGRIVRQKQTHIDALIRDGEFFQNEVLGELMAAATGHTLHLIGLVSDGGVHSHNDHLYALLEMARDRGVEQVRVHVITDGRDVGPTTGRGFVRELAERLEAEGLGRIATVSGRYYAMDRDRRWPRTNRAYDAIVCGKSENESVDPVDTVQRSYDNRVTDEFIEPTVVIEQDGTPVGPITDGDAVLFFNFRADRARQLSFALTDPKFNEFERCRVPRNLHFATMMEYHDDLDAPFAFALPEIDNCLAEVLATAGKKQYHSAETEKYAHVTFFFNATREEPFLGEERRLISSPKVATYDLQPEMSAPELSETAAERIREHDDDFFLINFANPDMVGHTGIIEAAIAACEATDAGLGMIIEALRDRGGRALVVADHGNAEVMIAEGGGPHTAHTTNPVPCILVDDNFDGTLRNGGKLGDIAPTILELMGIEKPDEMTGESLLVTHEG